MLQYTCSRDLIHEVTECIVHGNNPFNARLHILPTFRLTELRKDNQVCVTDQRIAPLC